MYNFGTMNCSRCGAACTPERDRICECDQAHVIVWKCPEHPDVSNGAACELGPGCGAIK